MCFKAVGNPWGSTYRVSEILWEMTTGSSNYSPSINTVPLLSLSLTGGGAMGLSLFLKGL
jgi:hypothetical protein